MKLTSFIDALLGDGKAAHIPLGESLTLAQANQVKRDIEEILPGFATRIHYSGRWWLIIERQTQSERVIDV